MNWLLDKTPPSVVRPEPYASPDDGEGEDHAWWEVFTPQEEDCSAKELGQASTAGEEVIFRKLRPSSSTHSTYMNSHDIRTPPQIIEDQPAHYRWQDNAKVFYPTLIANKIEFERNSLDFHE
jgi:hypothetical protein